jgi:GNAT superfamily N-acetyltransferase
VRRQPPTGAGVAGTREQRPARGRAGSGRRLEFVVRPYRPDDEPKVLELLTAALGPGPVGQRTPAFFRWKHLENPFGPSFMLVADLDGRVIGFRAFLRWRFDSSWGTVHAVRAVDTATHPEFQGLGVFSTLTRQALDLVRRESDLVFNTPNARSRPGYLKMGWRVVGRLPVHVRVLRPLGVLGAVIRPPAQRPDHRPVRVIAPSAAEALADARPIAQLLEDSRSREPCLATPRDLRYLEWRYGAVPGLDYRALTETVGREVAGLAIFRVRERGRLVETTVSELIVRPDDTSTALRLLRRVGAAARTDHLACRFDPGLGLPPAWRTGTVPAPRAVTFVVNPLRDGLLPDPTDRRSWALSLGDLEVF